MFDRRSMGRSPMYAVSRTYSGPGAHDLFDVIEARKEEIEGVIRPVTGFVSYTLFRTSDGGVTITVCQDKVGTDESSIAARKWIMENAPEVEAPPPLALEGPVVVHLS